jgi:hypothetical protein
MIKMNVDSKFILEPDEELKPMLIFLLLFTVIFLCLFVFAGYFAVTSWSFSWDTLFSKEADVPSLAGLCLVPLALLMIQFFFGQVLSILSIFNKPGKLFVSVSDSYFFFRVKDSEGTLTAGKVHVSEINHMEITENNGKHLIIYGENGELDDLPFERTDFDVSEFNKKWVAYEA